MVKFFVNLGKLISALGTLLILGGAAGICIWFVLLMASVGKQ